MTTGRDLACKEGPGADVTKTTGHSRHTSTRPSLLGNISLDPSLRGGIAADGVASLAPTSSNCGPGKGCSPTTMCGPDLGPHLQYLESLQAAPADSSE